MSIDLAEYKKLISGGVYEVLDLSKYDFKRVDELVAKAQTIIEGYDFTESDLELSHYYHVVVLVMKLEEWETVKDKLDPLLLSILEKIFVESKDTEDKEDDK